MKTNKVPKLTRKWLKYEIIDTSKLVAKIYGMAKNIIYRKKN